MTGTFELQLYDESDNEYLIEVEFTLIDPVPRSVGLTKQEVLHLAADLFWERDMLNDFHRDQEDYYSGW